MASALIIQQMIEDIYGLTGYLDAVRYGWLDTRWWWWAIALVMLVAGSIEREPEPGAPSILRLPSIPPGGRWVIESDGMLTARIEVQS